MKKNYIIISAVVVLFAAILCGVYLGKPHKTETVISAQDTTISANSLTPPAATETAPKSDVSQAVDYSTMSPKDILTHMVDNKPGTLVNGKVILGTKYIPGLTFDQYNKLNKNPDPNSLVGTNKCDYASDADYINWEDQGCYRNELYRYDTYHKDQPRSFNNSADSNAGLVTSGKITVDISGKPVMNKLVDDDGNTKICSFEAKYYGDVMILVSHCK